MANIFSDVVALAKAGWTPAEVKELMKVEKEGNAVPDTATGSAVVSTEVAPEVSNTTVDPEPDYKALYEDTLQKLNDAQNKNTREPIENQRVDISDTIANISKML